MDSACCHESVTCVLNHSLQTVYAKPALYELLTL